MALPENILSGAALIGEIAAGVALGIILYKIGVFVFRKILFVAFFNWVGKGHRGSRVTLFYYPWETRLKNEDPNYISDDSYWFPLKNKT